MNVLLISMPDCVPFFDAEWVKTPTNNLPLGNPDASDADNHIDFDDDEWTLQASIAGILTR